MKKMLDIIMDVDDSAIRALIQNLQVLRMKNVPRENMGMVEKILKESLIFIQKCKVTLTDIIGLMNSTMCSAYCDACCVSFGQCTLTTTVAPRQKKWAVFKPASSYGVYANDGDNNIKRGRRGKGCRNGGGTTKGGGVDNTNGENK